MHQLASSILDSVAAVALVVGVMAVAVHPAPVTFAIAGAAMVLLAGRLIVERRHGRRT